MPSSSRSNAVRDTVAGTSISRDPTRIGPVSSAGGGAERGPETIAQAATPAPSRARPARRRGWGRRRISMAFRLADRGGLRRLEDRRAGGGRRGGIALAGDRGRPGSGGHLLGAEVDGLARPGCEGAGA